GGCAGKRTWWGGKWARRHDAPGRTHHCGDASVDALAPTGNASGVVGPGFGHVVNRAGGYQHSLRFGCLLRYGLGERSKKMSRGYVADGRVVSASRAPAQTSASIASSEQKYHRRSGPC